METNRIANSCNNFVSSANSNRWNCDYVFLLTVNNPVFCTFMFWTSVLMLKMLMMTLLTAYKRFRNKVTQMIIFLLSQNIDTVYSRPSPTKKTYASDLLLRCHLETQTWKEQEGEFEGVFLYEFQDLIDIWKRIFDF